MNNTFLTSNGFEHVHLLVLEPCVSNDGNLSFDPKWANIKKKPGKTSARGPTTNNLKKWASKIRSPKTTSEDRVFDFEQFQAKANEAKSSDEEEMTENQKAFFKPLYMKSKDKPQPKRGPGRPRKNPAEN